jgi:nucleotide-binding universal stress UspA family protein
MKTFKTILLTTDFSETSKQAMRDGRAMAEKFEARIVLAYVAPDRLPAMVIEYADASLEDILARQKEQAAKQLELLAAENLGPDVPFTTRVVVGAPHVEITKLAEECNADLIVMATHGHGFISHAVLGSTTERVLHHAPCPVLVVREKSPK